MQMPTRRIDIVVLSIAIITFFVASAFVVGVAAWDMMLGPCACSILMP